MSVSSSKPLKPRDNVFFGSRSYQILQQIGSGSFGLIYLVLETNTKRKLAVKLEDPADYAMLKHEYEIMNMMKGKSGIPTARWYGKWEKYNVLIMDHLGPSLEELFKHCSERFSLQTVLMLADQMINRLELFHNKGCIHRDIKPSNFLMGNVFLIDFGLSKSFRSKTTGKHIIYREDRALSGTRRYVSVNGHLGIEQSRRDDLESLGHMLIEFLNGKLPWQSLKADTSSQKDEKIRAIKMSISPEELTKDCPEAFLQYMKYCRSLEFQQDPDYQYLRRIFFEQLKKVVTNTKDLMFDWTCTKNNNK